ncbi:HAD-IA family hydrolase [Mameliella sediminis]|uniref:HAD-IA family hydrolase n=1 Tax=Mameliella sediminis TaxID=2836866 RepID=UPI001C48CCA0|nr:HAD-IA family hydrolase [Mameliella sediminis]MBV7394927.1 HAD-IA family hydrolase [Mameliella sediminis]MBY6113630.1 HAD-IA family hydrolase [Antarctobacter heliothermus]MBY6143022.1 HAD-IA family hydrolase [Mameliella alba]MCA0953254.1 HAD-IA family hydrolase [Mameliella alba]
MNLSLVIFDVDGTLVDSQGDILGAMGAAFGQENLPCPSREEILSIVGLSLPQAFTKLVPEVGPVQRTRLVEAYKEAYANLRLTGGPEASPLYPGIPELLDRLSAREDVLLGIATGKSRRGLTALLESHGMTKRFVTRQCADGNPSKPHPAMLFNAVDEAGVEADRAVMIGDTSYDMEMAEAAGIARIAVTWGYHPREALTGAQRVVDDAAGLERAIQDLLGDMA